MLICRVFSIGRFLTTLLYWKGMFDMLDSFSEWFVSTSLTSEPPLVIINMVKIIMIAIPRFVPQFSVTLAACLLFILGAFKSAAITPPVRKIKHIWGR